ncbi:MAG: radical SAM protein [Deltaproteobacteria bacterium]|jgi:uncharacterized radical SAM superfamily Fe-S cluster-containing enzyme|nr:radical SAM protein [Deltaproteobacteria bacterium]
MKVKIPLIGALGCGPDCDCALDGSQALPVSEILGGTLAWCPRCQKSEQAFYALTPEGVFLERVCPAGEAIKTVVARTKEWFKERMGSGLEVNPSKYSKPAQKGCPLDCGPCQFHIGGLRLPVFSVTNQCQLSCPICFTHNRDDLVYYKSFEELEKILDVIENCSRSLDLINITGGEPFLHPFLPELLERCARRSFGIVTVNTNGLCLAQEEGLAEKIKQTGAQVILSLDTLEPKTSLIIHGADIVELKLRALERLEKHGVSTILLPVWLPGINDGEIPHILKRYFFKSFVKGAIIQTVAYTGFNGSKFEQKNRACLEDVEKGLSEAGFKQSDFFAHGSYHPLCYSVAYYLIEGQVKVPLTSLADKEVLNRTTKESYIIRLTDELISDFRFKVNDLWAFGARREELRLIKKLIEVFFGLIEARGREGGFNLSQICGQKERQAFDFVKTLTIHAHMDEDNFDLTRAGMCGDLVPEESGRLIPACSYNLIHRLADPRFWAGDGAR